MFILYVVEYLILIRFQRCLDCGQFFLVCKVLLFFSVLVGNLRIQLASPYFWIGPLTV